LFLQCLGKYSNTIITKRRKKEIFLNVDIIIKIRDNFFLARIKILAAKTCPTSSVCIVESVHSLWFRR